MPNPTRYPLRQSSPWGVTPVRSALAREGNTYTRRTSFVVGDGRCWRPGDPTPDGLEPDPTRAPERHTEHAARFAATREKARRAA
jgi:hypothetical protein